MPEELKTKSTTELIGVLRAISIVSNDMAGQLLRLQGEIKRRDAERNN